eukprot:CAMPEP_0198257744 /NCGR_PEP_ID=MMETSP1447-20131203/7340_1 /TAXON_ID=420782 /ORGANISM="Chaetoceros dichaeta, Strain CCMP1751" /LENGTH=262 /DNA_ID=CAMNT_0043944711 /DNA_START=17 /DNA_END=805 /DNA_ORIENTATION=-
MTSLRSKAIFLGAASCIIISRPYDITAFTFTSPTIAPSTVKSRAARSTLFALKKNRVIVDLTNIPESGSGNLLEKVFTGGSFENDSASTLVEAAKIASKIKSTKDLGWAKPPKRRGNTKPRHRAWGGESELPVQSKPNYDESNEKCVEKWLTIEDFCAKTKSSGPAADAAFVALAGGAKYAEREVCEEVVMQWRSGGDSKGGRGGGQFNEAAFEKSVKAGRVALFTGWGSFLSITTFFATCILFPTNPASKYFESLIEKALQ